MSHKLTIIHFIRHAQSEFNVENKMAGSGSDIPLTELGFKQADSRGQALTKFSNISYIVRSDMLRTQQTSEIINTYLNLEINIDARLNERFYGQLEGRDVSEFLNLLKSASESDDIIANHGGESISQLKARIKDVFCEYFQSGVEEILVVSHGHLGRIAYEVFYNIHKYLDNAEHLIFNPYEFDFKGKCNYNEQEF